MAFDQANLTPHDAASKGSKIWSYYDDTDTIATMFGSGYFNNASYKLQVGDVLVLTSGGTAPTFAMAEVTAVTAGTSVTIDKTGPKSSTTKAGGTLAVPLTARYVAMTTGGAEALTLADGFPGQVITLSLVTDGGDGTLTPATSSGWATAVFADAGDTLTFEFVDSTVGWIIVGGTGVLAPPVITV